VKFVVGHRILTARAREHGRKTRPCWTDAVFRLVIRATKSVEHAPLSRTRRVAGANDARQALTKAEDVWATYNDVVQRQSSVIADSILAAAGDSIVDKLQARHLYLLPHYQHRHAPVR
jgi:hypothetical protein